MSVIDASRNQRRAFAAVFCCSLHGLTDHFRQTVYSQGQRMAVVIMLATWVIPVSAAPPAAAASTTSVDMSRKPVPRLTPGILVGDPQQSGYSNVVTLAMPRLAAGEVDSLPEYAKHYAGMFHFTILANVKAVTSGNRTDYLLDRLGVGTSMDINQQWVIVTPDTANRLGADLRMIERGILKGNEKDLNAITQIARTSRMIIFDAPTNMLMGDKHRKKILRYFVWASPASGKLGALVWMLGDQKQAHYAIESGNMQLLPGNYREDRAIHVTKGPLRSNIPTANRFALVQLPQGTPVSFSARMRSVAALRTMNMQDLHEMMIGVSESLAQVPRVQQARQSAARRE